MYVPSYKHLSIIASEMDRKTPKSQICNLIGLSYVCFKKHYDDLFKGYSCAGRLIDKRLDDMCQRYKAGETMKSIGESYGITRERVRQVIKKGGLSGKDGGQSVSAFKNACERHRKNKERADQNKIQVLGCTKSEYDYYRSMDKDYSKTPIMKYRQQKINAIRRGIEWKMTINEWWGLWDRSGKWEMRGLGKDKYVMGRIADSGSYEVGNVEIILHGQNSKDYYAVHKDEWREKMIASHGWE